MTPDNSALLEIATFLARRWSGHHIMVEFSDILGTRTRLADNKIIISSIAKRPGDAFARYRQVRMDIWYESMRVRFSKKILSGDHAFGFVYNAMDTLRIEALGRNLWRGMDNEIVFSHAYRFISRPQLGNVYGRSRILEAFYQYFMFGAFRGEVQSSHFEKIVRASRLAKDAIEPHQYKPGLMERRAGDIIRLLDIDSLQTVPVSLPFMRQDMPAGEDDITRFLRAVIKNREGDFGRIDPKAVLRGDALQEEYQTIIEEQQRSGRRDALPVAGGIQVPASEGVDESPIYDLDLITGLKTRFRRWKSGYRESHNVHGEELDAESYLEGSSPFITDVRHSIKTSIVMLLDHSSSISADSIGYKKATIGLCEVLAYLEVKFAVYAFSARGRDVVCWMIKHRQDRWGRLHARRLADVVANGSTPLAQVYQRMLPDMKRQPPDIFLTLTDGEPSDPPAVRSMISVMRAQGIKMVALGLGPSTTRATAIAHNLRRLGYERTLATSRLQDIPLKVLGILQ